MQFPSDDSQTSSCVGTWMGNCCSSNMLLCAEMPGKPLMPCCPCPPNCFLICLFKYDLDRGATRHKVGLNIFYWSVQKN